MNDTPDKIYVERSGSNTALIAALILMAVLAVGLFVYIDQRQPQQDAVATAADKVGDAVDKVGDAAEDVGQAADETVNGK